MVKQSWVSTRSRSSRVRRARRQRLAPGLRAALERDDVAPAHRQEVVDLRGGAEDHGLAHAERGLDVGQHQGRGAVGDQRAVGALQRAGDDRVLLGDGAAELVAEVLAHLGVGVATPFLWFLAAIARQRVGLVAVALEIASAAIRPKTPAKPPSMPSSSHIGRCSRMSPIGRAGELGHLLDADDQHDARLACGDGVGGRRGRRPSRWRRRSRPASPA